jgi:hypothetical protein
VSVAATRAPSGGGEGVDGPTLLGWGRLPLRRMAQSSTWSRPSSQIGFPLLIPNPPASAALQLTRLLVVALSGDLAKKLPGPSVRCSALQPAAAAKKKKRARQINEPCRTRAWPIMHILKFLRTTVLSAVQW